MTDNIVKTTITITALHRADTALGDSIEDVLYEMSEGGAVGWETGRTTVPVPAERVQDELIAVGNDGTFFDDTDDDGEWHEGDPYFVAAKDVPAATTDGSAS